jgi:hypothetical protein
VCEYGGVVGLADEGLVALFLAADGVDAEVERVLAGAYGYGPGVEGVEAAGEA